MCLKRINRFRPHNTPTGNGSNTSRASVTSTRALLSHKVIILKHKYVCALVKPTAELLHREALLGQSDTPVLGLRRSTHVPK